MGTIRRALMGAVILCALTNGAVAQETTLRIATVDNGDMIRLQQLSQTFMRDNPGIALEWITLDENLLRQRVAIDVSTGAGRFDVVSIGTYEAPIWAERGWLSPLDTMPGDFQPDDILPTIRDALSFDGALYAAPFYGESSFTMYRTDLFEAAGLEMPRAPSWDFIKSAAATIAAHDPDVYGICLRGKPGWGENVALLTAMANAYGARWFDENWRPQLDSEAWARTVGDYVALMSQFGPPEATENGFGENLALFQAGRCGVWIDATAAASFVTDPSASTVADSVGFALAPDKGLGKRSNWLWAWALAVPQSSRHPDAAKRFISWATSQAYAELVASEQGWAHVPPGTRASLYENPRYRDAAPFAELTFESIQTADETSPTVEPVPYTGIQYVAVPEFQGIGTAVGQQIADVLAGEITVEEALRNAQWVAEKVVQHARFVQ
ncbi:ABC transporter substrate-binding protein [Marinivivus vitaminiproducens]|uniref:ABC transporter substrate-binding protein n=1 Tax=Marinivivus vitaminiproducens TaxID=3035935 RepID=UPI0027A214E4|nr:sugar ABC transporter substrate-binding protein [Geminicoccaceae bacterium SCSIO 64248]